ncbi:MAG: hypothetical protein AAFR53_05175 [Pseudomonadota bacterium]
MAREDLEITLFAGTFESQPLAFAHLYDLDPDADLSEIEVICKAPPRPRLAHYFTPGQVDAIIDAMGLHTSLILVFPEAGRLKASGKLFPLGRFAGSRVRA